LQSARGEKIINKYRERKEADRLRGFGPLLGPRKKKEQLEGDGGEEEVGLWDRCVFVCV
jgi:hypothetical protein